MPRTLIGRFRLVGALEAISFLVLLGIAMPLKYVWGEPLAVRIVGMAHGILFLLYCGVLYGVSQEYKWPLRKSALFFIAAFLPFGPFLVDGRLKEEDEGLSNTDT